MSTTLEPKVICPQAPADGEVCACEACILMRVMATSPTRPIDPEQLQLLVAVSQLGRDES